NETDSAKLDSLNKTQSTLEALTPQLKAAGKLLEARHKQWLKLLDAAEKRLRARSSKAFDGKALRACKKALLAADANKDEGPTTRDLMLEAVRQAAYFIGHGHWLLSRFPDGQFGAVPGLCKAVTTDDIAANDYSLTPGRYVGVAPVSEGDEEDFVERMRAIHDELGDLNERAAELAKSIDQNLEGLFA